jgi:hypothetical protein
MAEMDKEEYKFPDELEDQGKPLQEGQEEVQVEEGRGE